MLIPATEHMAQRYQEVDGWPTADLLDTLYEGQLTAMAAVRAALPQLVAATDAAVQVLGISGRLVYVGAGTSGRLGVLDGAELPPTFNWPRERLVFVMAGGLGALTHSVEGAEDSAAAGLAAMEEHAIGPSDVVIGLAASGSTPFTVAAIEAATARGAVTIGIANNPAAALLAAARYPVLIATGAEVIAGSTRMKAGTAQKSVLTMLSTAIMVGLGRVYRGLMVQMQATNAKLLRRAARMVHQIVGCPLSEAEEALTAAGGDVKHAILIASGLSATGAAAMLDQHGGNLRAALAEVGGAPPR